MTTQISHFIDGKRTAGQSKRTADVMDPNTGQVQAKVPMASSADVDAAVAVAVEAQKSWAAFNPQRRARVMMKFIDLVNQNIDELAEQCRFSDCSHEEEPGCAVREALADGSMSAERWDSYRTLRAEAGQITRALELADRASRAGRRRR